VDADGTGARVAGNSVRDRNDPISEDAPELKGELRWIPGKPFPGLTWELGAVGLEGPMPWVIADEVVERVAGDSTKDRAEPMWDDMPPGGVPRGIPSELLTALELVDATDRDSCMEREEDPERVAARVADDSVRDRRVPLRKEPAPPGDVLRARPNEPMAELNGLSLTATGFNGAWVSDSILRGSTPRLMGWWSALAKY